MIYLLLGSLAFWLVLASLAHWPTHTLIQGGKPYLTRWPLLGGDGCRRAPWPLSLSPCNVFLHNIQASDIPAHHNHPWDGKSLILWGSYVDERLIRTHVGDFLIARYYSRGDVNEIDAQAFHSLKLTSKSCWTLFWTGKKHGRGWGFMVHGKFIPASRLKGNARDIVEELRNLQETS